MHQGEPSGVLKEEDAEAIVPESEKSEPEEVEQPSFPEIKFMTTNLKEVKVEAFLTSVFTQESTACLDIGATTSLIHPHLVHKDCIAPYHGLFSSIDGSKVSPKGEIKNLRFVLAGKQFFHDFIVLDSRTGMLLGFDFLKNMCQSPSLKVLFSPLCLMVFSNVHTLQ